MSFNVYMSEFDQIINYLKCTSAKGTSKSSVVLVILDIFVCGHWSYFCFCFFFNLFVF